MKSLPMAQGRAGLGKATYVTLPIRTSNYMAGQSKFNENADSSLVKITKGFIQPEAYVLEVANTKLTCHDKFYSEDGLSIVKNNWKSVNGISSINPEIQQEDGIK